MRHKWIGPVLGGLCAAGAGVWFFFWLHRLLLYWGAGNGLSLPLALMLAAAALACVFVRPIPIKLRTVTILYLLIFGLLSEAVLSLASLVRLRDSGVLPAACSLIALLYADIHGKRTVLKRYTLDADVPQPMRKLRMCIGLLSDVHMGLSVDAARLSRALNLLAAQKPDLVILAGDLVDDQTTRAGMEAACALLGTLRPPLGFYFVYGNHDMASHGPALSFSQEELAAALCRNGVTILEDRCVSLPGPVTLAGRRDCGIRKEGARMPLDTLLAGAEGPVILVDHQPGSAEEAAQAGVMLQLSGHTHGGQLWPANLLMPLLRRREPCYGCRRIKNTWVIVSCGLGTRGTRLRSGSTAEAVLVELSFKQEISRAPHA